MEFGLLGPLKVVDGDRAVPIQAAKLRVLLACLLLRAGELVTVGELAEAIWGEALPADPRRVVHTYIARVRKLLSAGLLQSRPEGYVIAVAADDVDVGRFERLLEQARDAAAVGDRQREAAVLHQALHRGAAGLAERRLEALQRRIEADLALGRHAELVNELRVSTQRYPLREQFWAQLMIALYRCGRQADALQAYHGVASVLADELGIDPGAELRALHQAILTNDPALMAPPSPATIGVQVASGTGGLRHHDQPRPTQLPMDVADFVGRAGLVGQVERLVDDERRVGLVVLSGPPGVGKTALAVHVAHRLADRFVDGQLYISICTALPPGCNPFRRERCLAASCACSVWTLP
jgi:DNA-binding SARP family transcriptional activator